jgi:hypothetical protein
LKIFQLYSAIQFLPSIEPSQPSPLSLWSVYEVNKIISIS